MAGHRDNRFAIYLIHPELIAIFDIFPLGGYSVFPALFKEIAQADSGLDFIQNILPEVRPVSRFHDQPGLRDCVSFFVCCPVNLAAEIQTSTLEEFDKAVSELRKIDGIEATETNLLLSKRK